MANVESEVGKIQVAISNSSKLQAFLTDPSERREKKSEAVLGMLKEQNYSETVTSFFRVVAENGRLSQTMKILGSFGEIMRAHRREVSIKIVSAKELGLEATESLKNIINKRMLLPHQVPKLTLEVDPRILGGLVVEIGDKTIDLSVLTRVNALNKSLEESIHP